MPFTEYASASDRCVTMAVRLIISHSRQVILLLTFISCRRNVIVLDATTTASESLIIQETQI